MRNHLRLSVLAAGVLALSVMVGAGSARAEMITEITGVYRPTASDDPLVFTLPVSPIGRFLAADGRVFAPDELSQYGASPLGIDTSKEVTIYDTQFSTTMPDLIISVPGDPSSFARFILGPNYSLTVGELGQGTMTIRSSATLDSLVSFPVELSQFALSEFILDFFGFSISDDGLVFFPVDADKIPEECLALIGTSLEGQQGGFEGVELDGGPVACPCCIRFRLRVIPEPASLILCLTGAAGIGVWYKSRRGSAVRAARA